MCLTNFLFQIIVISIFSLIIKSENEELNQNLSLFHEDKYSITENETNTVELSNKKLNFYIKFNETTANCVLFIIPIMSMIKNYEIVNIFDFERQKSYLISNNTFKIRDNIDEFSFDLWISQEKSMSVIVIIKNLIHMEDYDYNKLYTIDIEQYPYLILHKKYNYKTLFDYEDKIFNVYYLENTYYKHYSLEIALINSNDNIIRDYIIFYIAFKSKNMINFEFRLLEYSSNIDYNPIDNYYSFHTMILFSTSIFKIKLDLGKLSYDVVNLSFAEGDVYGEDDCYKISYFYNGKYVLNRKIEDVFYQGVEISIINKEKCKYRVIKVNIPTRMSLEYPLYPSILYEEEVESNSSITREYYIRIFHISTFNIIYFFENDEEVDIIKKIKVKSILNKYGLIIVNEKNEEFIYDNNYVSYNNTRKNDEREEFKYLKLKTYKDEDFIASIEIEFSNKSSEKKKIFMKIFEDNMNSHNHISNNIEIQRKEMKSSRLINLYMDFSGNIVDSLYDYVIIFPFFNNINKFYIQFRKVKSIQIYSEKEYLYQNLNLIEKVISMNTTFPILIKVENFNEKYEYEYIVRSDIIFNSNLKFQILTLKPKDTINIMISCRTFLNGFMFKQEKFIQKVKFALPKMSIYKNEDLTEVVYNRVYSHTGDSSNIKFLYLEIEYECTSLCSSLMIYQILEVPYKYSTSFLYRQSYKLEKEISNEIFLVNKNMNIMKLYLKDDEKIYNNQTSPFLIDLKESYIVYSESKILVDSHYFFYVNAFIFSTSQEMTFTLNGKSFYEKYVLFGIHKSNHQCFPHVNSLLYVEVVSEFFNKTQAYMEVFTNFTWSEGRRISNQAYVFPYYSLISRVSLSFIKLEYDNTLIDIKNISHIKTICKNEWYVFNSMNYNQVLFKDKHKMIKLIYNKTESIDNIENNDDSEEVFRILISNLKYKAIYARKVNENDLYIDIFQLSPNLDDSLVDGFIDKYRYINNYTQIVLYDNEYLQIYIDTDEYENDFLVIEVVPHQIVQMNSYVYISFILFACLITFGGVIFLICWVVYYFRKWRRVKLIKTM